MHPCDARLPGRVLMVAIAVLCSLHAAFAEPAKKADTASPETMLGALSFSSSKDPIAISADTLEFDYKGRVLSYKGNVIAIQGDMKLQADKVNVTLNATGQSQQLREVTAIGKVRLEKGARWATAGRAVFDQTQRRVVLSENAVLQDGLNQVRGDRVIGYLDEARWVVEGGSQRVQAILVPPQHEATPEAKP